MDNKHNYPSILRHFYFVILISIVEFRLGSVDEMLNDMKLYLIKNQINSLSECATSIRRVNPRLIKLDCPVRIHTQLHIILIGHSARTFNTFS